MNAAVREKVVAASPVMSDDARRVRYVLIERGLETPLLNNDLTRDQKFERIRDAFADSAGALGLCLTDDSLCETPQRIAKMCVD